MAIHEFLKAHIPNEYMEVFRFPPAHIATLLVYIHKKLLVKWEKCSKPKAARSLSTQEKLDIPVLVWDAVE